MDILKKIATAKRTEVEFLKSTTPLESVLATIDLTLKPRFKNALDTTDRINIIAELKKGSPSRGVISSNFNPIKLAQSYRDGGAAALSVLTEQDFFYGRHEYIKIAREASGLPVLCKDFIIDAYQIAYAKLMGADAILLITRMLKPAVLAEFLSAAKRDALDALVEVHDESEIEIALKAGANMIGVNSRDLKDFTVDLDRAVALGREIPDNVTKVAESGIFTRADIDLLAEAGYNNFLVGEALVTASDPIALLRSFCEPC